MTTSTITLRRLRLLVIALTCSAMPMVTLAAKPGNWEFEAAYSNNDNVGFASEPEDIKEDDIVTLGARGNYTWQLSEITAFTDSAFVQYNSYSTYSDINNLRIGGKGEFVFVPRRGFTAPWYAVSALLYHAEYDIENRTGATLELRGTMGKRFTDRISGRAILGYNNRDAPDAFATDYAELVGRLDYLAGQLFTIYGGLGYRTGEITSTATPSQTIIDAATAIEPDPAIGEGRFAYRLDADTVLGDIGLNWGFNRSAALDISVQYYSADAGGDQLDYDQTLVWLALLFRI